MSENRTRKQLFLKEHPRCCFCGGNTASAEPDHVPGRAFCRDRQWPEGYEFPACVQCNRATRLDEQAIALLSRIYPDGKTQSERAEVRKLMGEVHRNHPGLFDEMQPSENQLHGAKTKYGILPPAGRPLTELPILSVAGPLLNEAMRQFSRKLFCALFYKHAGANLCSTGAIAIRWYANVQINADEMDRAIAAITPSIPNLERNTVALNDQFTYRWGITDTERMGAFLAFFRQSFAIFGVANQDADDQSTPNVPQVLRPYQWS
jgi:hypothetical protein